MRSFDAFPLRRRIPVLGFGCASLGSRISRRRGLQSLAVAWEHGVRWFDVAPVYGDGEAEIILGEFLVGRREEAVICTKFGIDRPTISAWKRATRPLARSLVEKFPGLRGAVGATRQTGNNRPIVASELAGSVVESLRRLRTDHIDVLALHEPTAVEAANPAILSAMVREKESGRVGALSLAGSIANVTAGIKARASVGFAQFPDSPFDNARALLAAAVPRSEGLVSVIHGVFGAGHIARFKALALEHPFPVLQTRQYDGLADAATVLMDYALCSNPDGLVLASMFSAEHIAKNARLASLPPSAEMVAATKAFCMGAVPVETRFVS